MLARREGFDDSQEEAIYDSFRLKLGQAGGRGHAINDITFLHGIAPLDNGFLVALKVIVY
jgi:hypothetical protein